MNTIATKKYMPDERLTLPTVATMAKQVLLDDGFHQPTLIAEGNRERAIVQIAHFEPTADERAQQLFVLGMLLAEEGRLGVLVQAFLITEAWLSVPKDGKLPTVQPSKDPQRKEVLTVSRLNVLPRQLETVVYEMKRDKRGKLLRLDDVAELSQKGETSAESPLLDAFAIGFVSINALPDD